MKDFLKKTTIGPVTFWNHFFFNTYFLYTRNWYRFSPMEAWGKKKILFVVPHVDDEVVGCGGLLAALAKRRNIVKCLYLTNGANSYHPKLTKEELAELRREEGRQVAGFFGLEPPSFLGLEDGAVGITPAAVEKVRAELHRFAPQIVFLPHLLDGHRDHVMATGLGLAALEKEGFGEDFPLYLYQSSSPFTHLEANRYFLLLEEFEVKKKALEIFKSQTMPFCGLLTLDHCRRKAVGGDKSSGKGIRGTEFFWHGSLGKCRNAFKSCSIEMVSKVRPMSSPYFLIWDYFSGWKFKKKIGKILADRD